MQEIRGAVNGLVSPSLSALPIYILKKDLQVTTGGDTGGSDNSLKMRGKMDVFGRDATPVRKRCNEVWEAMGRCRGRLATSRGCSRYENDCENNGLGQIRKRCNSLSHDLCKSLFSIAFGHSAAENSLHERKRCNASG